MGFFNFGRKTKQPVAVETRRQPNLLERLCEGQPDLYSELTASFMLRVNDIPPYEQLMARADEAEKTNMSRALEIYREAGSRALYDGNLDGVRGAFGRIKRENGKYAVIATHPEAAVAIAKAYYADPSVKRFMQPATPTKTR